MPVFQLPEDDLLFPDPSLSEPDGLLAIGGDLSPQRLILAYQSGIFPWFNEGEPILWWSPDPRCVLFPENIIITKSMASLFKKGVFNCSFDTAFEEVIRNCQSSPRKGQNGTWITEEMIQAYTNLHRLGFAHSIEIWQGNDLVGGLYGIILGKCFFGESMFSKVSNSSKMALIYLAQFAMENKFHLIDCQVHTEHLESMGAELIPRKVFLEILHKNKASDI